VDQESLKFREHPTGLEFQEFLLDLEIPQDHWVLQRPGIQDHQMSLCHPVDRLVLMVQLHQVCPSHLVNLGHRQNQSVLPIQEVLEHPTVLDHQEFPRYQVLQQVLVVL
jgi:hypothetical protein